MSSIIDVPFSQESWDKGMEYAKTSWAYTYNRRGTSNIISRLEKIALGVGIGEPSLGSFLKKDKINYNLSGRTKWYQSDIHDFLINDHKTDVKVIFLNENYKHVQNNFLNKKNNDRINHILNNCECLVPADQLNKDIYSFVLAQGKWIRQNENDLFKKFLDFWTSIQPDIVTGWNIQFFDIPYLMNRMRFIFDNDIGSISDPIQMDNQIIIVYIADEESSG